MPFWDDGKKLTPNEIDDLLERKAAKEIVAQMNNEGVKLHPPNCKGECCKTELSPT